MVNIVISLECFAICLTFAALILLLIIWKTFFSRRRYRYGRKVSGRKGYRGRKRR